MRPCVLITGASGGIGAATALAFAREGYPVGLGYFKGERKASALCDRLQKEGYGAALCAGDVCHAQGVERMFQRAEEAFGPVLTLVNCAGVSQQKMAGELSVEEWDEMFAVHARGSFLCCKRAMPQMLKRKAGCIVNVSSMWGQVGASCEVHYSAAKAAVIGLTKALAKELGPSHIRVNCVAPGATDTQMLDELDEEGRELLCEQTPLGRLGSASEVAECILFLAGEKASFLTGQVLSPNGGYVM
ncbi:3-oxoacyl-ACP reductase FabG [Ruminococcaceae bacterium OttesenSCG-928-I18]|nr:3-oxoacyl-ACP reductase FabG [Ruminococcaceae bacterium OttesenSCG-928-I18]